MYNPDALDKSAVIFDVGTGLCKAGLSGDIIPRSVIGTVVGHPRFSIISLSPGQKPYFVGEEAQCRYDSIRLHYPIERGVVKRWDDIERLWYHLYDTELVVRPSQQPLLMTEPSLNPKDNREKTAEIMFEKFAVPAFYLFNNSVGSLYASGYTTGLVLDSGDGMTSTVPIYEGYSLPHAVTRLNLAGRDISEHLFQVLLGKGYSYPSLFSKLVIDDMKEKLCFVNLEPDKCSWKKTKGALKEYTLPDGNVVHIGNDICQVPEVLFEPDQLGIHDPGLSQMVCNSIKKCDTDIQANLFAEIVMAGGNTLFPGVDERLMKELVSLASLETTIKITASRERCFSSWIGTSIITCMSTFKTMWVTAPDYNEFGTSVVQRKCF
ncbi:actin-related protein T1-like [Perognathus longimembris pacificus]|uniref:actin-related protein T1-like n=1 Tax=Perognathus longimembris pacificus TaxID=214514 RepID=UPI0020188F8E|nr:actin-related protein T1-like [Perognathus longimembris pacificus]